MFALTFHGKQTIKYESVPDPKILATTDAVVRVHLCGICGSDLHPYHEREKGLDHGAVMGHEFVGEIVDAGRDVRSFKTGDRVFSPFTTNCGRCYYCQIGLTCRCAAGQLYGWVASGVGLHGGQAEYVRIPLADSTLLKIPERMLPEEALLLGDVCSTGYFCADMAEARQGGVYAVIGCGPVGLMAIVGAVDRGAEKIYAIDSVPERLKLAEKFGAIPVDFQENDPLEVLQNATEGRGADAVMEVVGSPAAGTLAVKLIRPGGIIATVGVHTEAEMAFSPVEAYDKNLTYKIGRCPARAYMERLIPFIKKSSARLTDIITHRLPLNRGADAYKIFDLKKEGCIKVVLML
jgi:2-desacetyl-2-hydroxyethyl bacteriochlorophyllide A dehydrogenase